MLARRLVCLLALPVLACGQVYTAVGAQWMPEASADTLAEAAASSDEDASPCMGDLSNVRTGDFRISLTVTSTQTGLVALLNQRSECVPSVFWDIRMEGGIVNVEVDDVTHYTKLVTTGPAIDDGRPHVLIARRVAETLTAYVDGVDAGSSPSQASLGALAPLASGHDVCVSSSDGTVVFVGRMADVCVSAP